jgi:hypothetical protein
VYVFISVKCHQKLKKLKSRHMYFAFKVLSTLFQCNFDIIISAVLVVSSPD